LDRIIGQVFLWKLPRQIKTFKPLPVANPPPATRRSQMAMSCVAGVHVAGLGSSKCTQKWLIRKNCIGEIICPKLCFVFCGAGVKMVIAIDGLTRRIE
jgi:hypothetical protein